MQNPTDATTTSRTVTSDSRRRSNTRRPARELRATHPTLSRRHS
jgi:hypothetical protein